MEPNNCLEKRIINTVGRTNNRTIIMTVFVSVFSVIAVNIRLEHFSQAALVESSGISNPSSVLRLLWDLKMSFNASGTETLIMFFALLCLFYLAFMMWDKRMFIYIAPTALLLSFFESFGEVFSRYHSFFPLLHSSRGIVKISIRWGGLFLLISSVLIVLFCFINYYHCNNEHKKRALRRPIVVFSISTFAILLMWIPYMYGYWPGLTNYDFFDMLDTFYGNDTNSIRVVIPISEDVTLNNNNPVLQTLIAVGVMKMGTALGSPYYGIAIFCYSQTILLACVMGFSVAFMYKIGIPDVYLIICVLFYGLVPWHPNFALTTLKDTNYAMFLLLFTLLLGSYVYDKEAFYSSKWKPPSLAVVALISMLLRNNGVYVIAIFAIIFILLYRHEWKKIVLMLVVPVLIYSVLIVNVLYPALKIAPGSPAEMYSVPFQQIARIVKYHPESIDEHDEAIISAVLNDYDQLAERYDYELSDPVKSRFNKYATRDDMKSFIAVWAKFLKKYPVDYVEAAICECYGYFYPEAKHWLIYTRIEEPGEKYGLVSPEELTSVRLELNSAAYIFEGMPVLGLLIKIGFYSWILFFCLAYNIYRKRRERILLLVPHLIVLFTVIVGPANTMPRYLYATVLSCPIIIAVTLIMNRRLEENESMCDNTSI